MKAPRAYHNPQGDPCGKCGHPAELHQVTHEPKGDPCLICCLPPSQHRPRGRFNPTSQQTFERGRKDYQLPVYRKQKYKYIGIDGEGVGRAVHNYVLLAASTEDGEEEWSVTADPKLGRLTTRQCLDLILELPTRGVKVFAYAFNYDITKILTDLPNKKIYDLFRPNLPHRKRSGSQKGWGPYPVKWEDYTLNLQGTKFTVGSQITGKRVVIWDLIKFFQCKFVPALEDWKVGDEALWKRMKAMKDHRSVFDLKQMPEITAYCLEETRCMAQLAHKLVDSHESAGLQLKSFYGAGSSGGAMLNAMGIKSKLSPTPPEMREAVSAAFFGGRFENSVIGAVHETLHGWDISSAYVYQLAFLPCLEHGSWKYTKRREDLADAQAQNGALVRYSLGVANTSIRNGAWGPFPFRSNGGTISFPIESGGGWVWLDEFLAGERIFPHVQFEEGWVYERHCDCRPFGQIPEYYILRLQIGKEGPGIVIKLGMNSCYGKLAQSIGNALYNSWIWAGMITSGCRAQILHMMGLHEDMSNLLMIATDGILTREVLTPPDPMPTGTGMEYFKKCDKCGGIIGGTCAKCGGTGGKMTRTPLGGWEHKLHEKGMFLARPGIYFPLMPTEDEVKQVRARGVGRATVLKCWQNIVEKWETMGVYGEATVDEVSRFCGAKTSVSMSADGKRFRRANGRQKKPKGATHDMPSYGQWITRPVALSFNPMPKRTRVNDDGLTLELRRYDRDLMSAPYRKAVAMMTKEAMELEAAKQELMEQPDFDYTDYTDADGEG